MGRTETERVNEYVSEHRRHSLWLRIVGLFAVIVLCGTIYALILPAVAVQNGVDISDYVNDVNLYKANGAVWVEATTFSAEDNARADISFTGFTFDQLEGKDTVYITLPETISVPGEMTGESNKVAISDVRYSVSVPCAYYYLENGEAIIQFTPEYLDYLEEYGATVSGSISFEFTWDEEKLETGVNMQEDLFGKNTGSVTIIKTETDDGSGGDGDVTTGSYGVSKTAGSLEPSEENSEDGYITYTLKLSVWEEVQGPIILKDQFLWTSGVSYVESSFAVSPELALSPTVHNDAADYNYAEIVLGDEGSTIETGEYILTYRAKAEGVFASGYEGNFIYNKVQADGNGPAADSWIDTSRNRISKSGTVTDNEAGTVDWTVYINNGAMKDYLSGVTFTDTLADANSKITGPVIIERYAANGAFVDTTTLNVGDSGVTENSISYPLPDGQYYYVITYSTVTDTSGMAGGTTIDVKNAYGLTQEGGSIAGGTSEVYIQKSGLAKTLDNMGLITSDEDKKVVPLTFTSTIKTPDPDLVYYDYSGNYSFWYGSQDVSYSLYMTTQQFQEIAVTDANGLPVDEGKYTLTHGDPQIHSNMLFQLEFLEEVEGPVSITYTVYADVTSVPEGWSVNFENYFHGGSETVMASATVKNTIIATNGWISKYTSQQKWNGDYSTKYDMGTTDSIDWVLEVNKENSFKEDVTITDTIPAGLEVDEDSVLILLWASEIWQGGYNVVSSSNYTIDVRDNEDGTQTFTIDIAKDGYYVNNYSQKFFVLYTTKVTDEEFLDSSKLTASFTNYVELKTGDDTDQMIHEVTVSRDVIGKNGSYDPVTKTLDYEVVVNPDGADLLTNGEQLCVTDRITDDGGIGSYLELTGVSLFTAVKDGDGNTVAGTLISSLRPAPLNSKVYANNTYTYDPDTLTIKAYVADEHAYVLVYSYLIDTELAASVTLTNSAEITGNGKSIDSTTQSSRALKYSLGGEIHTENGKAVVIIKKHDREMYGTMLGGAVFELTSYSSEDGWNTIGSYTTGEDSGSVQVPNLDYDTLYCLKETQAPTGYKLDEDPYYFVIRSGDEGAVVSCPEGVGYVIYSDAMVFIDFYDLADEEFSPDDAKTSITIDKEWLDADGNEITDPDEDYIYVDVYQAAARKETLKGTNWWIGTETSTKYELGIGETIEFSVSCDSRIDYPNVTLEVTDGKTIWIDSNLGVQTNSWIYTELEDGAESTIVTEYASGKKTTLITSGGESTEITEDPAAGETEEDSEEETFTLTKGHKYTARITCVDSSHYTITYMDATAEELCYTVTVEVDPGLQDGILAYVIAQQGTYTVSPTLFTEDGEAAELKVAGGVYYGTYKVKASDNWTLTIDDLPATVEGSNGKTECIYYVQEVAMDGYEDPEYGNNDGIHTGTITITNKSKGGTEETDIPEEDAADLTVQKKWLDMDGNDVTDSVSDTQIGFKLYQVAMPVGSSDSGAAGEESGGGGTAPAEKVKLSGSITAKWSAWWNIPETEVEAGSTVTLTFVNPYGGESWAAFDWIDIYVNGVEATPTVQYNGSIGTYTICFQITEDTVVSGNLDWTSGDLQYEDPVITSSGSSSGSGSSGDTAVTLPEDSESITGTGWWAAENGVTSSCTLEDGGSVEYLIRCEEAVEFSQLTLEIQGGGIFIDSNFGVQTNAWTANDISDPVILSDVKNFRFEQGHVYKVTVTRNRYLYTFTHYDITDGETNGEYCYRTSVITCADLPQEGTSVYIKAQYGTFTVSGTSAAPETEVDTSSDVDTGEVKLIGTYTLGRTEYWASTISDLPTKATDADGNITAYYKYYVLETDTGNNAKIISVWNRYENNGTYEGPIIITNTLGNTAEDVFTELTIKKQWLAYNGTEIRQPEAESVSFHLYRTETAAQKLTSEIDDFTTKTASCSLDEGETVQFTILYNGYTGFSAIEPYITLEVMDRDNRYVDSNFGCYGNAWTFNDTGISEIVPAEDRTVSLVKGHIYTATVTRSNNAYTFIYYDVTAGEESYRKTVKTDADYQDAAVYVIVQRGTYTISGKNLADGADSAEEIGTLVRETAYTICAEDEWTTAVSDLPAQGTDADGNPVIYTYYVEEVETDGYTAAYRSSTPDEVFDGGSRTSASAGTITITNQKETPDDSGYELPMTGGSGNAKLYTFGAVLTAIAMALLMYRRKTCRKEAQRTDP